ncbi:hypothetical protein FOVSG1_011932 [Fusarium oxysporum f. sp. vasinfectum]
MHDTFVLEVAEHLRDNVSLPSLLAATRRLLGSDPGGDRALLSRPGRQVSPTPVQLPQLRYMRCLFDVCSTRLAMYLPTVEYDEINSKAIQPGSSTSSGIGSFLIESRDFLLFSQLYITMTLGHCLLSQQDPGRDVSEAWSFYYQSLSLIAEVPPIPAHWLGMAKFHLFRAIFLMQADDLQAAVQAISSSLQYAWQAKLNDQPAWLLRDPREVLSRKKLWWAIYCMERRLCQKIGKPSGICDKEVAVDDILSREQLAACHDLEVLPEHISQDELHLQLLVDISRLWGKVWDKFFRAGSQACNNDEKVDMMGLRITHLHRSVPAIFRWSNNLLDSVTIDSELDLQISRRLVIHLRYALLRLLIRQNPSRTEPIKLEHARFCHILVCEVVDILSAFIAAYSLPRITSLAYFISSALIECSYHIASILQNPVCRGERPAAMRTMERLTEMLKLLAPTVKTAQRAVSILRSHSTSPTEGPSLSGDQSGDLEDSTRFEATGFRSPSAANIGDQPLNTFGAEMAFDDAAYGLPLYATGVLNEPADVDELLFPYFYLPDVG